jgi:serine/threonine protein kinase
MTRRGEDEPKAKQPPEAPAAGDRPPRLLTSEDIFGDMLDAPEPAAKPAPAEAPTAGRKRPIKVQVSEPGAQKKEGGTPGGGGELPEDVAALLDAFAEPEAGPAAVAAAADADAPGEAAPAEGNDALLDEILSEGPPDPVSLEAEPEEPELDDASPSGDVVLGLDASEGSEDQPLAGGLIEDEPPTSPAAAPPQPAPPPDAAHAEGLRDLLELQPPRRSILHPLDALGQAPRPPRRTGTKFQAATPKAVGEQPGGLDLAAVAEGALVPPRPAKAETPAPTPRVPVTGAAYGPYQLLERVAIGGMAEVFKAKRTGVEGFEKVLAVKRILPHLSDNKEFVDMFIDEAKMVAGLAHPNIVQIFDLGKIEKSYYIAMEYVHGRDLRSILRRAREKELDLPLELALLVASRVASALEFAHRKKDERGRAMQIVHRDISPQNILISFEGEVKLTDFGIAKAATKASITDTGALRGKLLYMSPEQAWGKAIDRRSDVFSLGIVLYEMVTDHRPFLGHSEMSILEMVRECQVARPSTLNPGVPEMLENVIMLALAREPDDRYQDAAEMRGDLDRVLREWQSPQAGALARFMELLFDEEERSDSVDLPPAAEAAPEAEEAAAAAHALPAPGAPVAVDAADGGPLDAEPAGVLVINEELDLTPPPTPQDPPPEPPPAPESLSQRLLKKFGIK